MFEALRARGLRIGILSNTIWSRERHEAIFARDGMADLIDGAVYSSEIEWTKPHPLAFRAALDAVGIAEAADAVFVGDRLFDDIYGASAAGLRTIYIPHSDIPVDQIGHTLGEPGRRRAPGSARSRPSSRAGPSRARRRDRRAAGAISKCKPQCTPGLDSKPQTPDASGDVGGRGRVGHRLGRGRVQLVELASDSVHHARSEQPDDHGHTDDLDRGISDVRRTDNVRISCAGELRVARASAQGPSARTRRRRFRCRGPALQPPFRQCSRTGCGRPMRRRAGRDRLRALRVVDRSAAGAAGGRSQLWRLVAGDRAGRRCSRDVEGVGGHRGRAGSDRCRSATDRRLFSSGRERCSAGRRFLPDGGHHRSGPGRWIGGAEPCLRPHV